MCTPDQERIIRQEVAQWMMRGKKFTSVDIGNSVKQRDQFIPNREVAQWLRNNVVNIALQYGHKYEQTLIDVQLPNGSWREAYLYHPQGTDPADYTARSQKALSPDEAQGDNPTDPQEDDDYMNADSLGGDDGDPAPYSRTLGVATLKGFKPKPYQEIHIYVEHVDQIMVNGSLDFQEED